MEYIVLVDENDTEAGFEEKLFTHRKALLHRAFSVFIYNESKGEILLQRRAKSKYHSGGLWTNSCCSHQRKGEKMSDALARCIKDELCAEFDIEKKMSDGKIKHLGKFKYFADFGNLAEYEIDNVFLFYVSDEEIHLLSPIPNEIDEIKWLTLKEINIALSERGEEFTAWFPKAYSFVKEHLS